MQWKINSTRVICLRMGKATEAKPLSGDFKVTTPKNPLLSITSGYKCHLGPGEALALG